MDEKIYNFQFHQGLSELLMHNFDGFDITFQFHQGLSGPHRTR